MTAVRFPHTSDWQLGMTRHFLEGEAQARYSAARIDATDHATEEDVGAGAHAAGTVRHPGRQAV